VPAIRRIIVEMVWRMILFQPQYKPVQKWQEVLRGPNPALKKKAVIAIGRQLIVDLWRLQTGRVTAQELNLVAATPPAHNYPLPLTLQGSEYAHAVHELNKAIDRAEGLF
jgi:hypothetical protein